MLLSASKFTNVELEGIVDADTFTRTNHGVKAMFYKRLICLDVIERMELMEWRCISSENKTASYVKCVPLIEKRKNRDGRVRLPLL